MTPRSFLVRGLLAGLIAGILTFAVAYVAGEPSVDAAIALEDAAPAHAHDDGAEAHTHGGDDPVVSRDTQSTWGLLTATTVIGVSLGGIVGLASAFAVGRLGRLRPSQSTALVAALGFVSFALVPFLKYPATPPAVGSADTIGDRTTSYFAMLLISVLAMVGAVLLGRELLSRLGTYWAVVASAAAYVVVVAVAAALLPTVNELGDFPADTLWEFRRGSLLTLVSLWGVLGIALTGLVGRLYEQESAAQARRELAASL
jgi:hypothetical protein